MMASDMTGTFLNTNEFGETGTFYPGRDAVGFSVTVTISEITDQFLEVSSGVADSREADLFLVRSTTRTAIGVIETSTGARDPRKGDSVVIATGANAGTWRVATCSPDIGDCAKLHCRYETFGSVNSPGAVKVR